MRSKRIEHYPYQSPQLPIQAFALRAPPYPVARIALYDEDKAWNIPGTDVTVVVALGFNFQQHLLVATQVGLARRISRAMFLVSY